MRVANGKISRLPLSCMYVYKFQTYKYITTCFSFVTVFLLVLSYPKHVPQTPSSRSNTSISDHHNPHRCLRTRFLGDFGREFRVVFHYRSQKKEIRSALPVWYSSFLIIFSSPVIDDS